MFRKLLFLLCLAGAPNAFAQVGITPVKTTQKPADPKIDYSVVGAPMPPLRYLIYRDTTNKKDTNIIIKTQTSSVEESHKHKKKRKKHEEIAAISGVNAGVSKEILTNDDLDNGANLFIMMFNPTCSHCQDETVLIGNNADLFKRSKLVLIAAPVQKMYIGDFIKYTRFEKYPFYLGIDSSDFINKVFLYKALPQINIYDKHRKLIKAYSGEVAIDSLKNYIQ